MASFSWVDLKRWMLRVKIYFRAKQNYIPYWMRVRVIIHRWSVLSSFDEENHFICLNIVVGLKTIPLAIKCIFFCNHVSVFPFRLQTYLVPSQSYKHHSFSDCFFFGCCFYKGAKFIYLFIFGFISVSRFKKIKKKQWKKFWKPNQRCICNKIKRRLKGSVQFMKAKQKIIIIVCKTI